MLKNTKYLNKQGSALMYIVVMLFFLLFLLVIFNSFYLTAQSNKQKNLTKTIAQERISNLEMKLLATENFSLTDNTEISEGISQEDLSITLIPKQQANTRVIKDNFKFTRNGFNLTNIDFTSNYKHQIMLFIENQLRNNTEKFILDSNNSKTKIVYSNINNDIILLSGGSGDATYNAASYRINYGKLIPVEDYPTNTVLSSTLFKHGDIVEIFYYSKSNEIVDWQRSIYAQYGTSEEVNNKYYFLRIPQTHTAINNQIIKDYDKYEHIAISTDIQYDVYKNKNSTLTEIELNVINNIKTSYTLNIEYEPYDVYEHHNYVFKYSEGGDEYKISEGITEANTISFTHEVEPNYLYTNKDKIHLIETTQTTDTRKLKVSLGNVLIKNIEVVYEEFSEGIFEMHIRDSTGKTIDSKEIIIN